MPLGHAFFVSDLHLFSRRSRAGEHLPALRAAARKADTFVLGGDIFDFRWTTLDSIDRTVDAASKWLEDLAGSAPRCQFHMLLGNHDHHGCLMKRLDRLAGQHENLSWDPFYFRRGDCIFLHGDAADGDATHGRLVQARTRRPHHKKQSAAANLLYDAVVSTHVHRTVPAIAYPHRRTAGRLLNYLGDIGHGYDAGVRHVYFGHTHRALDAYELAGVQFHNGGAPIRGVPFRIVEVIN